MRDFVQYIPVVFVFVCCSTDIKPHHVATAAPLGGNVERQVRWQGMKLVPLVKRECVILHVFLEKLLTCGLFVVPTEN